MISKRLLKIISCPRSGSELILNNDHLESKNNSDSRKLFVQFLSIHHTVNIQGRLDHSDRKIRYT